MGICRIFLITGETNARVKGDAEGSIFREEGGMRRRQALKSAMATGGIGDNFVGLCKNEPRIVGN